MAILGYVGLPGSGKSYSVVEHVIIPALEKGRRVWTNIPLDLGVIEHSGFPLPVIFDTQEIVDDPEFFQKTFEAGATIVIDECWRFWPAGTKANKLEEGHKSFFAEHRHMVGEDGQSTEIILVTQDLSQIAAYVRNLVEFTYRSVKLNAVGLDKKFRIDIYQGAVTGPKPPESQRLRQLPGSYKPKIYRFYKSQTMNKSDSHGVESITDSRVNILNSNTLKFGAPAFLIVMLFFMYYGFSRVGEMYGGQADDELQLLSEDNIPAASQAEMAATKTETIIAPDPRLVALLRNVDVSIIYNQGVFPYIDYVFSLKSDDSESQLTLHQLRKVGFQVTPIARCVALIVNRSAITKALCRSNVEQQADAFESMPDMDITSSQSF